jgi:hypothetical protein
MLTVVKPRFLTIAIHIGIWSMVLLLPYLLSSQDKEAWQATGNFFTLSCLIHIGIFYGNALYLYPRFANRRKWWLYLPLAAGLVIVSFHLEYEHSGPLVSSVAPADGHWTICEHTFRDGFLRKPGVPAGGRRYLA